jgi:hypothetical protein
MLRRDVNAMPGVMEVGELELGIWEGVDNFLAARRAIYRR